MFGSRDRSWCLLSLHELGLDPKLNLEPLNYLSHSFVYLVFVLHQYTATTMLMYT